MGIYIHLAKYVRHIYICIKAKPECIADRQPKSNSDVTFVKTIVYFAAQHFG